MVATIKTLKISVADPSKFTDSASRLRLWNFFWFCLRSENAGFYHDEVKYSKFSKSIPAPREKNFETT